MRGVNCPKIHSGKRQLQQVIDGQRRDKRYMRAEDVYYEPFDSKESHDCVYHLPYLYFQTTAAASLPGLTCHLLEVEKIDCSWSLFYYHWEYIIFIARDDSKPGRDGTLIAELSGMRVDSLYRS